PQFYGLPVNTGWVELVRDEQQIPENIALADDSLVPFLAGETVQGIVSERGN
ncbi:dihydroorotase, partial [Salmonella enterica subsp. enterica serovar Montevideo]|nr:dihydroorotase [Salmonella enterica subsp. enterica serovar Montevideo]